MKTRTLLLFFLLALLQLPLTAETKINTVSGVYVGGHFRRARPTTITHLRFSGFTYVLLFNVTVEPDGSLTSDGATVCKDGKYVFNETWPYYREDVKKLKTPPTSIQRVEIVIGGWTNESYFRIRDLINANGTGSNTILYKNFKALKQAVPEIEAINNDDEHCYDVETAAKFHIMMYNLGYHTTIAPYTYMSFWQELCSKIRASKPKAVDCVMVQCYDGGAGNVNYVGSWTFQGVPVRHAGLMYYSNDSDLDRNLAQFQKWKDDGVASGGFVWVYNGEDWDLNAWASGMNRVFKAVEVPEDEAMVEVFSGSNYTGYSVKLPIGTYTKADLALYGLKANDAESIRILKEGASARLYKTVQNNGSSLLCNADRESLPSTYNNKVNSITVEYEDPVGIDGLESHTPEEVTVYSLDGKQLGHGKNAIHKAAKGQTVIVKTGGKAVKTRL